MESRQSLLHKKWLTACFTLLFKAKGSIRHHIQRISSSRHMHGRARPKVQPAVAVLVLVVPSLDVCVKEVPGPATLVEDALLVPSAAL